MKIIIGKGSCGIAAGAAKVESAVAQYIKDNHIAADIEIAGCIGMCYLEPIIDVIDDAGNKTTYTKVDPNTIPEILSFQNSEAVSHLPAEDAAILGRQKRIALRNCGIINPEKIEAYLHAGGYQAIENCLKQYTPDDVISIIKTSGLAGRGGAGFPTWFKWDQAKKSKNTKKYLICNADEGDPGAFMDRSVLEGDPHTLIEGMMIGAYAIGSDEGIVYVRAEYPLAIQRLTLAINQATEKGYLGKNIFGSNFNFTLRIKAGAGAFVCGEETALIASLEGERGMPRLKPPFPAQKGYWDKPSNINNVETFANVAWIINHGGEAFASMGTENSKGTKVFALTGKIKKGGLIEIPIGMSIKEVIYDIGGGIKDDKEFKAVQMGGPSGGCIPNSLLDIAIDYKNLQQSGAIMGSGGMVVMDETSCMVDMARYFLDFTRKESCGKCIHCRIGTKRMLEILERICAGDGKEGDIDLLYNLAMQIKEGSLCGLGQSAPNPVLTTIRYFRHEYEAHIKDKKCPAKQCKPLLTYSIDTNNCTGCTLCARNCPTNAINGQRKQTHAIDQQKCIQCGKCQSSCHFNAVNVD